MYVNECFFSYGMAGLCCGMDFYTVEGFEDWETFVQEFQKVLRGLEYFSCPREPFVRVWPKAGACYVYFSGELCKKLEFLPCSLAGFRQVCKGFVLELLHKTGGHLQGKQGS